MSRRSLIVFDAVASTLLALAGAAGAIFLGGGEPERPPSLHALDLEPCRGPPDADARGCSRAGSSPCPTARTIRDRAGARTIDEALVTFS